MADKSDGSPVSEHGSAMEGTEMSSPASLQSPMETTESLLSSPHKSLLNSPHKSPLVPLEPMDSLPSVSTDHSAGLSEGGGGASEEQQILDQAVDWTLSSQNVDDLLVSHFSSSIFIFHSFQIHMFPFFRIFHILLHFLF